MGGMQQIKMQRLSRLNFFSRREVAELPNLLVPGEQVIAVLSGFYTSGTAILCVTSRRLLLIDKKIVRLSYEDIRFEAISDINFSQQAMLASARFYIAGRNIQFRSWYKKELRILVQFVQDRMFEAHHRQESTAVLQPASYSHHFMNHQPATSQSLTPIVQEQPAAAQPERHLAMPSHLVERVQRWQRAARFVGDLSAVKR